jgi:hypothetical protein
MRHIMRGFEQVARERRSGAYTATLCFASAGPASLRVWVHHDETDAAGAGHSSAPLLDTRVAVVEGETSDVHSTVRGLGGPC